MNRFERISLGVITAFILTACGSQGSKIASDPKIESPAPDAVSSIEADSADTETGLDEVQSDHYKMIVLPTQINLAEQNNFPLSPSSLSDMLSNEISTALFETHRFDILSINYLSAEEGEISEVINGIDTDFYLKSTLNQLDTQESVKTLKATGQQVEEKTVSATIHYQIIDAKNNKVVFNRFLRYQLTSTANNETYPTVINNTIKSITDLMKNEIINEIYPIRILNTDNEEIILDYPLPVDSQCEVIRFGEKVKNVYTDNVLGFEQRVVGKLRIIQNSSVLAYGQLIDGVVEEGDACKPLQIKKLAVPELTKLTIDDNVI